MRSTTIVHQRSARGTRPIRLLLHDIEWLL